MCVCVCVCVCVFVCICSGIIIVREFQCRRYFEPHPFIKLTIIENSECYLGFMLCF